MSVTTACSSSDLDFLETGVGMGSGEDATDDYKAEYLVLDFSNVMGVDATAVRSCFLMLVQLMRASGVTVVFTDLNPAVLSLFTAHNVIQTDDVVIPKVDDALEWCEEQILHR
jgi:SulP family sulfate permease